MSIFLFKSILGIFFLLAGLIGTICMLALMGRPEKKISSDVLRKMHKGSGFVFCILLLILSYFCIKYWVIAGDQISVRAVLHGALALGLIIVLFLKLLIVRFYKQFLRIVPTLGMIVFSLAFVVTSMSTGFYVLRALHIKTGPVETASNHKPALQQSTIRGESIFNAKCGSCHFGDKEESKAGPGLKHVLKNKSLPFSKKPATIENIKNQLKFPALGMPSFKDLTEQELAALLAYLQTL
ncbi:c-type cytochrome [Acidobacteriota bacterium]